MGVDDEWMEQEERGWHDPGKWVCQHCVGEDSYLRHLVRVNLTNAVCSYCKSKKRKAAPLSVLMDAVLRGVKYSYNDEANAGCPYGREISIAYQSSEDVLYRVLESEGLEWPEKLVADVSRAFTNYGWVDAPDGDWMGSYGHERLHWSWNSFAHVLKHHSRFHFHLRKRVLRYGEDMITAHEMLPFLGQLMREHRMVRKVSASEVFHRVRPGSHPCTVAALGPPPKEKTTAGRMNPAGIPYFYLAFDEKTALTETRVTHRQQVTVSQWSPSRDLLVIDLSHCPSCPSVFSEKKREYGMVRFLYAFRDEISKSVAHDGSEHIEYVPTQVVSEYFSQAFTYSNGKQVDGLIYPSSVEPQGKNLVVFPRHEHTVATQTKGLCAVMELKTTRTGRVFFGDISVA